MASGLVSLVPWNSSFSLMDADPDSKGTLESLVSKFIQRKGQQLRKRNYKIFNVSLINTNHFSPSSNDAVWHISCKATCSEPAVYQPLLPS